MGIAKKRLSDEVAIAVLERIRERGLAEGDRLPSQAELAAELGISVPSLREGLQTLATLGFIRVQHGVGTEVGAPSLSAMLHHVDPALAAGLFSSAELREALEMLLAFAVEPSTGLSGRLRSSEDEVRALRALAEGIGASESPVATALDLAQALIESTGNRLLVDLFRLVATMVQANASFGGASPATDGALQEAASKLVRSPATRDGAAPGDSAPTGGMAEADTAAAATQAVRRFCSLLLADTPASRGEAQLGTGSIGGSFYSLGVEIARTVAAECGIELAPVPTGGGPANVEALRAGDVLIGMVQAELAAESSREESTGVTLSTLCGLHNLDLWIVCRADSGLTAVRDLAGRRISLGAERGESRRIARRVLAAAGVAENAVEAVYLPIAPGTEALREGSIDALFYLTSGLSTAIERLRDSLPIRLLGLDEDTARKTTNGQPHWSPSVIFTPTQPAVRTVATRTLLLARSDLPQELAYCIVHSLYTKGGTIPLGEQTLRGHMKAAMHDVSVPIHPGARTAMADLELPL